MQPSLQPRPGLVRVDLASRGRPVRVSATVGFHLEGMVASPDMVPDLQTLCATPCTVFVSPAASALHVGDLEVGRVDPSGERILVNPGSRAVRNVGRGALIVGVIGTIGGVLMLALGGDRSMLIAGGATIGGSAAVGVTGFLLQLFYSDRMERSPLVNAPARGRIRWAPSFSARDGVAVGAVGAF